MEPGSPLGCSLETAEPAEDTKPQTRAELIHFATLRSIREMTHGREECVRMRACGALCVREGCRGSWWVYGGQLVQIKANFEERLFTKLLTCSHDCPQLPT